MLKKKSLLYLAERCAYTQAQSGVRDSSVAVGKRRPVQVPKKKTWSKNAVLASLCNVSPMDPSTNVFYPQTSVDLGLAMLKHRQRLHKAILNAESTFQFLKERESNLLKIDWNVDSEIKAGIVEMPIALNCAETVDQSMEEDSTSVLNDLMAGKQLERLQAKYQELNEIGEEIPPEMKEKVFSFACYHIAHDGGLKLLLSVLNSTPPSNSYMFNVLLRGFAITRRYSDVEKWFTNMRKAGFEPDIKTVNKILGYANQDSRNFTHDFVEYLKKSQITPTAGTIIKSENLVQNVGNMGQEQKIIMFAKCLSEIEMCTDENRLDALITLLGYVADTSAAFAVLLEIEKMPASSVNDGFGFSLAMKVAHRKGDYVLADRIFETANRLNITMLQPQYLNYLELLGQHSSVEKFIETACVLVGSLVHDNLKTYETLLKICYERLWPQALPGIYSIYDGALVKPDDHLLFVKVAIRLADNADAETRLQLKRIAFLLLDLFGSYKRRVTESFLSYLCVMFARYGDQDDLITMLVKSEDFIQKLNLTAIKECRRVIGSGDASFGKKEVAKFVSNFQATQPRPMRK